MIADARSGLFSCVLRFFGVNEAQRTFSSPITTVAARNGGIQEPEMSL
jgi:hypothetical protein